MRVQRLAGTVVFLGLAGFGTAACGTASGPAGAAKLTPAVPSRRPAPRSPCAAPRVPGPTEPQTGPCEPAAAYMLVRLPGDTAFEHVTIAPPTTFCVQGSIDAKPFLDGPASPSGG